MDGPQRRVPRPGWAEGQVGPSPVAVRGRAASQGQAGRVPAGGQGGRPRRACGPAGRKPAVRRGDGAEGTMAYSPSIIHSSGARIHRICCNVTCISIPRFDIIIRKALQRARYDHLLNSIVSLARGRCLGLLDVHDQFGCHRTAIEAKAPAKASGQRQQPRHRPR